MDNINNLGSMGLDLMITNKCNFNCAYCIENEFANFHKDPTYISLDRYSFDDICNFIDKLTDSNFFKSRYNILDVHLWGGEPTLDINLMIKLITKYLDHENVIFMTSTNGYKIQTLLSFLENPEIQNKIKYGRDYFHLQISYDGKIINDLKRHTTGGEVGTNYTLDSIKYTQKNNIKHSIKSTLPFDCFNHIYDSYHDIIHILKEKMYNPTIDYRQEEIDNLTTEEIDNIFIILKQELFKVAKEEFNYIQNNNHSRFAWFNFNRALCTAGQDMFCIDVGGGIYPCHGCLNLTSREDHYIGHINDDNIIDSINRKNIDYAKNKKNDEVCNNCDAVYCLTCNASKYGISKKDNYHDKWRDFSNQTLLCKIHKYISNINRAINKKARKITKI